MLISVLTPPRGQESILCKKGFRAGQWRLAVVVVSIAGSPIMLKSRIILPFLDVLYLFVQWFTEM